MRSILFFAALLPLAYACNDGEDVITLKCGPEIRIVDVLTTVEDDPFNLISAEVEGTCLTVTIGTSGCGSTDWKLDLVTFGEVAESSPTQTSARLIFDDGVLNSQANCLAYITETYTFDLSPYLTESVLPTILTLTGEDTTLLVP